MKELCDIYRDDPELLRFYKKKLLIPGWAGQVTDAEARYIAAQLKNSPILRAKWNTRAVTKRFRTIEVPTVKRLVRYWNKIAPDALTPLRLASAQKLRGVGVSNKTPEGQLALL